MSVDETKKNTINNIKKCTDKLRLGAKGSDRISYGTRDDASMTTSMRFRYIFANVVCVPDGVLADGIGWTDILVEVALGVVFDYVLDMVDEINFGFLSATLNPAVL